MRTIGRHLRAWPAWPAWLGAGAVAGLGLLLALAATIGPPPAPPAEPGASLVVRLPDAVRVVVLALFALSALLLLALQRPRHQPEDERDRERRGSAVLASLPILLLLLVLLYLAWRHWVPGDGHPLGAPLAAVAGLLEFLAQARKPPTSAPAFDYAIAGLLLLLAFGTFAVVLLVALAERIVRWRTGPAVAATGRPLDLALAEGLDDLRADPDARQAIIRAYRRFELALSAARVPRAAWQTHSEFMRTALAEVSVPGPPVARLTALFELARFSDRPLGTGERDAACQCLGEIRTALDADPAHAR